ncbi:MAG TPA: mismatch-specific DNA-glycosylase [Vicinamibacterales bacterium]|nr:mismatch-specific DNA-glycosylase [Vicinamibacterales bacterium]
MAVILPPLRDVIRPPVRVLLVGINPGVKSSQLGHHFAGPSNRFWKLLYESRLVPEPIGFADDVRLPEWGIGMTNLIPRPTPGIDTLKPAEYIAGAVTLRKKIRRVKPEMVAFVGVTLFRSVFGWKAGRPIALGPQEERFEGARVFVLPNPSGRNANYSYAEMLDAFTRLRRALEER